MSDLPKKILAWHDLGHAPYKPVWELQERLQKHLIEEKIRMRSEPEIPRSPDFLLFVEHPHVYTLGKSGDVSHLLASETDLEDTHATFVKIDRGGDITYHGPGQIVGYPIMDLDRHFTDIHKYLRLLEEVIIRVCADFGLEAIRIEKLTGVWVNGKKVCAMGIKCSRWVTMHGFALNVNTQLEYFGQIVPCGITDRGVTSLKELTGAEVDTRFVKTLLLKHIEDVFEIKTMHLETLPVAFQPNESILQEK
jgi:lipoyl(octanoyl) transferase